MSAKGAGSKTEETALVKEAAAPTALDLDIQRVVEQTIAIQKVMRAVMREGEHYGVVPGTERYDDKTGADISKRTLYQPGADKLCLLFRLRPEYEETSLERDDFIFVKLRCRLVHIPTGEVWGEGLGSCNSREAKYANQAKSRVCPTCGKAAIAKGAKDYGGGWYCNRKKDGCGAKYGENDPQIVGQSGQVDTQKTWDMHNTIFKMAAKRSRVAAVLTATAASDIFTQDLEDLIDDETETPEGGSAPASGATSPRSGHGNGNGNGNGGRKVSPIQVRDLMVALNDAQVGFEAAKDMRGREKEDAIIAARLRWVNSLLGSGRAIKSMTELTVAEIESLIKVARQATEEPGGKGG